MKWITSESKYIINNPYNYTMKEECIHSLEELPNFNPIFEVAGSFIEYDNKILLLLRQDHKPQPNVYGMPAGKIDKGESPVESMIRELREETWINLVVQKLNFIKKLYVRYPTYDFVYHIFHSVLNELPDVIINPKEHKEYIWVTLDETNNLQMVPWLDVSIDYCYKK